MASSACLRQKTDAAEHHEDTELERSGGNGINIMATRKCRQVINPPDDYRFVAYYEPLICRKICQPFDCRFTMEVLWREKQQGRGVRAMYRAHMASLPSASHLSKWTMEDAYTWSENTMAGQMINPDLSGYVINIPLSTFAYNHTFAGSTNNLFP